jgi:hypothetical protein
MRFDENEFGRPEIPSDALTLEMVPAPGAEYYPEVIEFALTFNGYSYYPKNLAEIAIQSEQVFRNSGKLPRTLNRLRACLFFQQRFWRNDGGDPDEQSIAFINAILACIRSKIQLKGSAKSLQRESGAAN